MSIAKKYGISEDAIKAMVRDGILPCSVIKCDEILSCYSEKIAQGIPKYEAVHLTSDEANVSLSYVYRIINRFQ